MIFIRASPLSNLIDSICSLTNSEMCYFIRNELTYSNFNPPKWLYADFSFPYCRDRALNVG